MIYLISVNYNSTELITQLLKSIQTQMEVEYQVILVNNSPTDLQVYKLQAANVQILEAGTNLGFGGGCNLGLQWVYAQDAQAIAWLINPDTRFQENTLDQAFQFCSAHPQISIIGTVVVEPDGKPWFAGGEFNSRNGRIVAQTAFPSATPDGSAADYVETSWVTGCSMLINLRNFATCPSFDPAYFLYYEDFDFCRRYAQQGQAIALTHQIRVIHQPSSITGRNPALKLEHSTYSYLLALEKHTKPGVVLYRLTRILAHAARSLVVDPARAIAIIKGVQNYLVRGRNLGKFPVG